MGLKLKSIRIKLILLLLAVSLIPLVIAMVIVEIRAENIVKKVELQKLSALRSTKHDQMKDYFKIIDGQTRALAHEQMAIEAIEEFKLAVNDFTGEFMDVDEEKFDALYSNHMSSIIGSTSEDKKQWMSLDRTAKYMQQLYIINNKNEITKRYNMDNAGDGSTYSRVHEKFHNSFRYFLKEFGYYDIFLIDAETGRVLYSVAKKVDYGTSLKTGPYAHSSLGKVFQKALEVDEKGSAFEDFQAYAPSYNESASFIAAPVYNKDKLIGVIVFQMPVSRIGRIMGGRAGLGETGETFLVGPDSKMRSNSVLAKEPTLGKKIDSSAIREVLEGKTGDQRAHSYRNLEVLSSFQPLEVFEGVYWGVVAEIAEEEIFEPIAQLKLIVLVVGLVVAVVVLIIAIYAAKVALVPIHLIMGQFTKVSDYDLTERLYVKGNDEISWMGSMFNDVTDNLSEIISQIRGSSTQVAAASEETSASTQNMTQVIHTQGESLNEISKAVSDMTKNINMIQSTAASTSENVQSIAQSSDKADAAMKVLDQNAREIAEVTKVISDISDQINLLALNAAIEAARAGDAGRGFAVVADEVRKLAQNTNESTEQIATVITNLTQNVGETGSAIQEITSSIGQIAGEIEEVSTSIGEQSAATEEISSTVEAFQNQMATVTKDIEEINTAANDIAKEATEMSTKVNVFKVDAS